MDICVKPQSQQPTFLPATAAAAGPLLYYQVDPVPQPLGFVYVPRTVE